MQFVVNRLYLQNNLHGALKDNSGFYNLGLILVVVSIIPVGTNNIALTILIADIWEHGKIWWDMSKMIVKFV